MNIEADLSAVQSVKHGAMASIICHAAHTARPLGVLQLDRGPIQDPFDESDFYMADAIAATVAVGIESALLVRQERDQFIQTVTVLARTVDVRNSYTGDHTRRVTDYSLLLADALRLSARTGITLRSAPRCTTLARSASTTPFYASRAS